MPSPPESRGPEEPERRLGPDAPDPRRGPAPPGSAEEALRRIEERLDRASQAAERLIAEAAAEAATAGGEPTTPPPAGWQLPGEDASSPDLDPFITLVHALRDLIPPELQRRLVAALRELLLALRALIDWYLDRLERRREQAVEVQDIPIL
jgi:hypothetical protein